MLKNKFSGHIEFSKNIDCTPFFVVSPSRAAENVIRFKKLLPDVKLFYAVKSNSDLGILKSIDEYVDGYDIASVGEFEHLERHALNTSNIVYSNPVKVPGHISEVYGKGVRYFAYDSVSELTKIKKIAPDAKVYLRIKVSDYGSKFPLSSKFGADPMHALPLASTAVDMGLDFIGVAFHVGSQSEHTRVWLRAFAVCEKVIKSLKKSNIKVSFIDIGGGFPADYGDPIPSFEEVAEVINNSISPYLKEGITVIAEPGRFVSADTSIIVASVIGRENRNGIDWLYLDMGVFQGLLEPLEMKEWRYPIYTERKKNVYKKSFILTGPTCDAYDTIGSNYLLPADLDVGDRIYICVTGSYALVYASTFNGFQIPTSHYLNLKHEDKK